MNDEEILKKEYKKYQEEHRCPRMDDICLSLMTLARQDERNRQEKCCFDDGFEKGKQVGREEASKGYEQDREHICEVRGGKEFSPLTNRDCPKCLNKKIALLEKEIASLERKIEIQKAQLAFMGCPCDLTEFGNEHLHKPDSKHYILRNEHENRIASLEKEIAGLRSGTGGSCEKDESHQTWHVVCYTCNQEMKKQNQKYREALERIAKGCNEDNFTCCCDEIAKKVLEEGK